ncbi:MAG: penicillin-binding protein 1C [Bacteroidia bacterium]|nr:penicillin-binding protein 1C [Bacteroidia bacterium]
MTNRIARKLGRGILKRKWLWSFLLLVLLVWSFCLPAELFKDPYSTILLASKGELLGGRIAPDGQWRFPLQDTVPDKFAQCITTFEDKRFYGHLGVDPIAFGRAMWLNMSHGEILSGGSTITMQVIRLARKGKSRTVWEKAIEMVWATRLEWRYSKSEILALYAAHAPFGGNIVGLEAASWKYMGRSPHQLSWAESATLAVLPNAPGLIHPGKNRALLEKKRNRLLVMLLQEGRIDSTELELGMAEPLPDKPLPIPNLAPHLLERARKQLGEIRVASTIDLNLQIRTANILEQHHARLRQNDIHNAAILVADIETGSVLAYLGNTPGTSAAEGHAVDIVTAARSSGSILKPLLYAAMLHDGELLPKTLVADIPSYYGSFVPSNFDRKHHGAVQADEALARSLNIPAVRMLHQHGVPRFAEELKSYGINTLFRPADDYGLSLILGGAEVTLWDLAGMYASMGRMLDLYGPYNGRYEKEPFQPLSYQQSEKRSRVPEESRDQLVKTAALSAGSIWHTFEAMQEVARPGDEAGWRHFGSSQRVAWKTGTSFGFRDAWAIGVIPGYVVAVWVGNADGEGRPGLIGAEAAAPIMFDVVNGLERAQSWFRMPYDDLREVEICAQSGHRAGEYCTDRDSAWIQTEGAQTNLCPYHQLIWLSKDRSHRVHSDCESIGEMIGEKMFVLPPAQEAYYQQEHPEYRPIPGWRADCLHDIPVKESPLSLLYPTPQARIYLPTELDGTQGALVLEAKHRRSGSRVFWHVDESYLGETNGIHQQVIRPGAGRHLLSIVDEEGNRIECEFEIIAEEK